MRRLISDSRAGVGVIFAVLLGSGALLAVIALGLDFGRVYLEQQTLRNAASSGALALANACSNGSSVCASQASAEAFVKDFLDTNSPDGQSGLQELCGNSPLVSCAPVISNPRDCSAYQGSKNLVRVTASSVENGTPGMALFFTIQNQVELWQCAQAEWLQAGTGSISFQTQFDLGFPACDYQAGQAPVVWYQFQNIGANPGIPRKATCDVLVDGNLTHLVDVTNGLAGLDIPIGNCTTPVTLNSGDVIPMGETKFSKLCNKEVETFLASAVSTGAEIPVAVLGQFVRKSASQIDFDIAGQTKVRILGYLISNKISGGVEPPGGWSSYPPGAPNNVKCKNANPCIYGYYSAPLSFGTVANQARLVLK